MVLRPAALGELGRADELFDGAVVVTCGAPVAGESADRLARDAGRVADELCDQRVSSHAVRARQQVVGDVADQTCA